MMDKKKEVAGDTDKKASGKKTAELLAAALEAEMGEIPKVSITVEELRALEQSDRKRKHRKKVKMISAAAAAVVVCIAAIFALWPQTAVPVDAEKNTEVRIGEKDGAVVINEGEGIGDAGITEIDETDWDKVESYRDMVPSLGIPEYVPEGYKFKKAHIEIYENNGFFVEYNYVKANKTLLIRQRQYISEDTKTNISDGEVETIKTKYGDIYIITSNDEPQIALMIKEKNCYTIVGTLEKQEISKIFEGLAML